MGIRKMAAFFGLAVVILMGLCACGAPSDSKFTVGKVEPVAYENLAHIYVPETGIVNPPTVVQTLDSETGFPDAERTPAVCILEIDEALNITEGEKILTTVQTFMDLYRDRVIPAFWISSSEEADALIAYLEEQEITDAYVMADSEQAQLVYRVRTQYRRIQGALRFESIDGEQARRDALITANNALAMVICTPQHLSLEDTAWFNTRLVSVWAETEAVQEVYRAIASGYNGVICRDTDTVYDVYESITKTTVSGISTVIGHRGTYDYLENTIASFRKAYEEYGCPAVEMDLRLSRDKQIVVMHDDTVDRTTDGTGEVSDLSLEQLKQLQVSFGGNGDTDEIPTFEEVLQAFQDEDLVLVCHIHIYNSGMMDQFKELVKQYGYEDRVIAFLTFKGRLDYNYKNLTGGFAFASATEESLLSSEDPVQVVENFTKNMLPFHFQPLFFDYVNDTDPDIDHENPAFYYQMCARGFLNWHSTTTGEEYMQQLLLTGNGASAALVNEPQLTGNYYYALQVGDQEYKVGEKIELRADAIGQLGVQEVSCDYIQVAGSELSGDTCSQPGSVTVVCVAQMTTDLGTAYQIFSEPIEITFSE